MSTTTSARSSSGRRSASCIGDLAAHRVPDQRDRLAELLELGGQQLGHVEVVDAVGPGRVPVVGQVDQGDAVRVGQALARSSSSSCPGRTGRGRTRPADPTPRGCATRAVRRLAVVGFRHPAIPSDVPSVPPLTVPGTRGRRHARTTAPHGEPQHDQHARPAPRAARRRPAPSRTKKPVPELPTAGPGGAGVGARRAVPGARAGRRLARRPAGARVGGRRAAAGAGPLRPAAVHVRAVPRGRAEREAPAAADRPGR